MEQKKFNPAEGRLGLPSLTGTGSHVESTKRDTDYGFGRLGITSDAESESAEPVLESSENQKTPTPHTGVAEPITVSPEPGDNDIDRQAESADAARPKHRHFTWRRLSGYKVILGRGKKKKILLLAGIPVIAAMLFLWFFIVGGRTVPQVATAVEQSPRDQPVASRPIKEAVKQEPAAPGVRTTRRTTISPASPAAAEAQQRPESGQTIPAAAMARSAFRETVKFLARMKPKPETTTPSPARTAPPLKPDEPRDAGSEPIVSKVTATASASKLGIKLGGIIRGADGNYAIINKRFVGVGRTVNNAKIVHIGDFSVEIELKGKRYLIGISSSR